MHFWYIFQNPEISFVIKWTGVDQVLTKILQIDPKLTFNVFHILNHVRISKIEKNIWWYRPPPKKAFFGRSVPSNIFSILEIRPWFKIWKTLKVSFWSICNILVNTWSTPKYFTTNENWRYRKMTKKCIFCQIKEFPTHLNQNLDVFSKDNVF